MLAKAFLQPDCLDMVLASAVEVCPRETNGILIGSQSYRRIRGRRKPVLELRTAYPIQTAERTPSGVTHGNEAAVQRLMDALNVMGKGLAGGFHSHPYPGGHTFLTRDDVRFIEDDLKRLRVFRRYRSMNQWFELVLSVKPVRYQKRPQVGRRMVTERGALRVRLRTENYRGFDVRLRGYLISMQGGQLRKRAVRLYAG